MSDLNLLTTLAHKYGSDKAGVHSYTSHYEKHFAPYRDRPINILEIGVGGYEDPNAGGPSLKMWRDYFPLAKIAALDYFDKSPHATDRVRIYRGDQSDPGVLNLIHNESGPFDIIIDDGSHVNAHVLASFSVLFPLLNNGGLYVVEDVQTAYWHRFGGSPTNCNSATTSVGFFKSLVDGLNYKEIPRAIYEPSIFDESILSICFYHNIVFITKGDNTEESNVLRSFRFPPEFEHLG